MSCDRFIDNALTIVIPVFNEQRYLAQLFHSIKGQTYPEIKVLIGDNASTDESPCIIKHYASQATNVDAIYRKKNIGAVANLADLVKKCKTEFVSMVGAHDLVDPEWAESLIRVLQGSPEATLAYSRIARINDLGSVVGETDGGDFVRDEQMPDDRILACIAHSWGECTAVNGIFRTSVFDGFWFPKTTGPDHILLARASYLGKVVRLEKPLYYRRSFNRSSSYTGRIKGDVLFAPSRCFSATVAAHVVDFCVLNRFRIFCFIRIRRLTTALSIGYGRLGFSNNAVSYLKTIFWSFYFLMVVMSPLSRISFANKFSK